MDNIKNGFAEPLTVFGIAAVVLIVGIWVYSIQRHGKIGIKRTDPIQNASSYATGSSVPQPGNTTTKPSDPVQNVLPSANSSDQLFHEGFENGALSPGWTSLALHGAKRIEDSDSIQIVTDPVRKGTHALKVTVRDGDWVYSGDRFNDKERAELIRQNSCRQGTCTLGNEGREGTELWYAWSILIPEDYQYDRVGHDWQIMGQWHDQSEPGESPSGYSPPISVHYRSTGGQSSFVFTYGLRQTGGPITEVEAPIKRGKWINLMFHIGFSQGKDGFLEVWKDGVPVKTDQGIARITGPNMFNAEPNYLRIGLYRGVGQKQTNTLYYDEIKIATTREALLSEW